MFSKEIDASLFKNRQVLPETFDLKGFRLNHLYASLGFTSDVRVSVLLQDKEHLSMNRYSFTLETTVDYFMKSLWKLKHC